MSTIPIAWAGVRISTSAVSDLAGIRSIRRVRVAQAALTFAWVLLLMPGLATARAGSLTQEERPLWEDVRAARQARADSLLALGPEIKEPFFAFLLEAARGDSLGTWDATALAEFADGRGRPSRFPLELLDRLTRRRPTPAEDASWPRSPVRAVWELDLVAELDRDLPYNILGYHPGRLRGARHMLLTEVHAQGFTVTGMTPPVIAAEVIFFRLDRGHLLLDVDGLVDRLLGKALDDAGTIGFMVARYKGNLVGLAVSLGKDGRRVYGEFDFRRDKVLPNGRPVARALSAAGRKLMTEGYQGPPLGIWVDD